jgi:3-isopropylmalate/(R)-2-methylmalate dehydratase small subunit
MDFGFRAIIAPSFADIFASNSRKNGLVLVVLPEEQVNVLSHQAEVVQQYSVTVDLESCLVSDDSRFTASFTMDEFVRHCLLEGLDDIGLSIQHEAAITTYEKELDSLSYTLRTK